ncbi:MAG: M67 family metallopeptidase [Chloroflexota bacterium]
MLQLNNALHEQIQAHGAASYPYEGCGLLLGVVENGRNWVTAVQPLRNVWPDEAEKRERFRIDPDDWRDAEFAALAEGLDIIGIFHSHPDHPPIASPRDLAWASWPGYSYLITEVRQGQPMGSRSWQLAGDRSGFVEEDVEIDE